MVKYINGSLEVLGEYFITSAMVSNYVKMKIIDSPTDKTYSREQIAYLIYITIVKNVISLSDISIMLEIKKDNYTTQLCYDYFCDEFENVLQYVFGNKPELAVIGGKLTKEKELLRNTIMALVYKVYLAKYLDYFKNYINLRKKPQ